MISTDQISTLLTGGGNVLGEGGDKIGSIGQVYLDDTSGEPAWVTVKTGLFGSSESFIPLDGATVSGSDVLLPFTKSKVKDAPRIDADGHLSQDEEAELYRYYGLGYGQTTLGLDDSVATGNVVDTDTDRTVGYDTSGPTTDSAMTRSEEHLNVGTQRVEAGRARLRKFIVTENVAQTVTLSHDEARVVREPVTEANLAESMDGPEITEAEHEVTLYADRAVVTTETVPVERVRLGTETVTENQQVTADVRKEQIELDTTDTRTTGTTTTTAPERA